jgi:hypothetical protein
MNTTSKSDSLKTSFGIALLMIAELFIIIGGVKAVYWCAENM